MVFDKSGSGKTVTPDEALEEALCFGWIDGQIKSLDDASYLKRFTPRRKGSAWSARNRSIAEKLIEQGLMTDAGRAAIRCAKEDGTWDTPKRPAITDEQVNGLIQLLQGHEPALSNFLKMSPSVRRTYTALYLDAKAEATKVKRLQYIVGRLNENKKPM